MNLQLGSNWDGEAFSLNLRNKPWNTEGVSAFLLGNKGSGKSHALAVLAEEAHRNRLPFIFYDNNGDACSMQELGDDVVIIGNTRHHNKERKAHYNIQDVFNQMSEYVNMCVKDGFSLVIDLSAIEDMDMRPIFVAEMVKSHYKVSGFIRLPTMLILDEAHLFAPQYGASKEQKYCLKILKLMMSDGRKRSIYSFSATQQITEISKSYIALMNLRLFGKITHHAHFDYIKGYLPNQLKNPMRKMTARQMEMLDKQFLVCKGDGTRGHVRLKFKPRKTTDLGQTPIAVGRRGERPSIESLQLNMFSDNQVKNSEVF